MQSWDEEVDIIVAGSGAAGCSAAIGAHLAGAKSVLVLEKDVQMSGGTTREFGAQNAATLSFLATTLACSRRC